MTDILNDLRAAGIKRAARDEPMARHTSWQVGGPADVYCLVEEEEHLRSAVQIALEHHMPWLVLGGGNNILVSDAGIEGLVILNRLRGLAIDGDGEDPVFRCGAGVFFARAAHYTAKQGYTGMEWGISIPGTVGGGVVNNAGAHWSDVSRSLISADVVDAGGRVERLTPVDLAYQYRHSALKSAHTVQTTLVVTSCRFRVAPGDTQQALAHIEELREHRKRTQPIKEASAGSTFTNPPNGHAGALVEAVGLKGHRIGDAQISPLHANFIVNLGGATATDIITLLRLAQDTVRDRFGILLEPEVQLVGRWPEEIVRAIHPGAE